MKRLVERRRWRASTFSTPAMKAMSPPTFTGKNSSVIFVPNIALSAFDGTQ